MVEHYYTKEPKSKLVLYEINAMLRGYSVKLFTSSSVFSPKKVDKATLLLIDNMIVKAFDKVLDLGCGYGPVGITCALMGCEVTMSDINKRAVMLAKRNVKLNKVNARVIQSEHFDKIKESFNVILLNPPISAGMSVCERLINESFNHLLAGGSLQLVARHNKGGSRLSDYMNDLFGNVKTLGMKGGFRVYYSNRSK